MTEDQVREVCRNLEKTLIAAVQRGEDVAFSTRQFSKPVFSPEYGQCPIDAVYTGCRFTIEIGEPAEKRRKEDEATKRRLQRGQYP